MGGHITGVAIEQYPNAYDGAMPMCGVMGDNTGPFKNLGAGLNAVIALLNRYFSRVGGPIGILGQEREGARLGAGESRRRSRARDDCLL